MNKAKTTIILITLVILYGCATTPNIQLSNLKQNYALDSRSDKSVVFGKVIYNSDDFFFKRIPFLKFKIRNIADTEIKYNLKLGDAESMFALPWNLKFFKSEYFFIELEPGNYEIYSISMPYGRDLSNIISETTSIIFSIEPNSISYLGTLQLTILKNTTKVGGLPLLKAGFVYKANLLDEQEEAVKEFRIKYPLLSEEIKIKLMNIKQITNE